MAELEQLPVKPVRLESPSLENVCQLLIDRMSTDGLEAVPHCEGSQPGENFIENAVTQAWSLLARHQPHPWGLQVGQFDVLYEDALRVDACQVDVYTRFVAQPA